MGPWPLQRIRNISLGYLNVRELASSWFRVSGIRPQITTPFSEAISTQDGMQNSHGLNCDPGLSDSCKYEATRIRQRTLLRTLGLDGFIRMSGRIARERASKD